MVFELLTWVIIFLIITLIAGLFGFGTVAGTSAGIAKILFYIFLILFIGSLLIHLFGGAT